ncbi:MAG: hypothetical protein UT07_C0019G0001 [Parcubacteria group bacterium GW2011_GWB1_38_8]|uniref:DUF3800 domain-containing protein n=1 Tax=Candidatus Zambryskibacteria bacterium RIFCSPLOWO2_02_FULL_39_14 TaxID=1802769 RepID=A0A1G2UI62_9BACT|nr:MAG: hypothetical protein UT07_C0019G0001 [Parcubacteria group bacterium GW2011_GWB1_38_8]OHA95229.1 MAG: hypothetical protein A3C62_00190 [Candidatus Zambryskibacteria bacterium RIFCSPHIGHO2_02_FULL_39_16]OHB09127.1 MAG: hypothetical protein A3I86_01655 [Candidatus Zambryskibacteria bacterium RIFCSPLOWO2_02_FULL_39_14]
MSYIFLDESGDLGFNFKKKGTSKKFIITFLFVPESTKRGLEKVVKKTHSELSKHVKRRVGVLHATNEKPITRQRLLKRLSEKNCTIMTIYLNKQKVFTKLQDEKQVLYNYVTNILLDRIYSKRVVDASGEIELIASRRETNKFLNENFKDYLKKKVSDNHKGKMKISIKTPGEEKILQAVDFVSWAVFRKYEKGDDSYYNIIKSKIIEESPLFP